MPDLLVKLYQLPPIEPVLAQVGADGVTLRRALAPEKPQVLAWVGSHWPVWGPEVEVAFSRLPVSCVIALRNEALVGFACHDVTCRNFFGPEGVIDAEQGRGIGRALLLSVLHAQHAQGYAYSVIGAAGPVDFYVKSVGAMPIAGSDPGLYAGMLRAKPRNPPP